VNLAPFTNEPSLEVRKGAVRESLRAALAELDASLPMRAPTIIAGQREDGDALVSSDPGEETRVVALAPCAGASEVDAALESLSRAAPAWAGTPASERAACLLRAAAWMRARRTALAALCVREAAKPWIEADADVAEAIDFLEYYARGALELDRGAPLLQVPGERNELRYRGRGVCAVIAPWNFPLAIPTGMLSAALVTGNACALKPAEQTPGCGAIVAEALLAGGVPADALALITGAGEAGAALVRDERVHTIAFTGSSAVGNEILREAAEVHPGQRGLKRVVAELGGKNCVIVDSDADLDDTVRAVRRSAFAYSGQKCSAASRVLVHTAVADIVRERLAGAVETLQVGQAEEFGVDVGPVIDGDARARVNDYGDLAARDGTVLARVDGQFPARGCFCAPTLVAELDPGSRVLREEIFGPLLTIEAVEDVDDALERVDRLPFALTGGLFSRNPGTVQRVAERSAVGNLYVNRHITGAMVGRQPFGGNRLSGAGAKAGGPGYLLEFVDAIAVSENVVRHGLVVQRAKT
jgi:RHH-type proline utilization regulon transcriptional repressor/proline dehydrogenase/delta 1-pyrroline-5-carboxylate dehydrogenase